MMVFRLLTIIAVLGMSTALHAQRRKSCDEDQPKPDPRCRSENFWVPDCSLSDQVPAAYNMDARVNSNQGYNVFFDASFIYWNVSQDNMDIGRTALVGAASQNSTPTLNAVVITHPFEYQPGFKAGFGFGSNFDNWQFNFEYTYLHESNMNTAGAPATGFTEGFTEIIVPNDWYINLSAGGTNRSVQAQAAQMISKWRMRLDTFDGLLSRPFYQGQKLRVTPSAGLKGLWLRQSFKITSSHFLDSINDTAVSNNHSRGWGVGPELRAKLDWLLGMGFRFEFDGGVSLLYMRYTTLKHTEAFSTSISSTGAVNGHLPTRGYVRAVNELGLGAGWGTYFYKNRFHIDFAARYDFSIFWSQNMMRYTVSQLHNAQSGGYNGNIGDLYLHGMTLTGRFDF